MAAPPAGRRQGSRGGDQGQKWPAAPTASTVKPYTASILKQTVVSRSTCRAATGFTRGGPGSEMACSPNGLHNEASVLKQMAVSRSHLGERQSRRGRAQGQKLHRYSSIFSSELSTHCVWGEKLPTAPKASTMKPYTASVLRQTAVSRSTCGEARPTREGPRSDVMASAAYRASHSKKLTSLSFGNTSWQPLSPGERG